MPKRAKIILAIVIVAVAAVFGYRFWRGHVSREPGVVRVSGNIEVTDAELSFKIGGKVSERLVSEGEPVKAGQVVARLDAGDLAQEVAARLAELRGAQAALDELEAGSRPEEIAQAKAVADGAKSRLDELLAGSRPQEIAAAEAAAQRAKADETFARIEYDRARQLLQESAVTQRDLDRARADMDRASAARRQAEEQYKLVKEGPRQEEIEQARAAYAEAQQRYDLVKKGPRVETIEQARARVEQAKAAVGLAQTRLGYATIVSPFDGLALSDNVEPGEYVAPGTPVVTVGDLLHVWLRAYVSETDLGRVKAGQRVTVTADTWPGKKYEGVLSFISAEAEFTPKSVQTEVERVKLVYRVKIDIANPSMELKPGMPADAAIQTANSESETRNPKQTAETANPKPGT